MSQVHMRAFSPNRPCQHNTRLVYLDDHGYDAEGTIMEEIPAGGCTYVYLVGDFSFERLREDEQLLVVPFVMRTLRGVSFWSLASGGRRGGWDKAALLWVA